ncbi:MAG: DoxX family membrane protein [Deltaproteobacteria bacterium]|nr:DoxX family membrane protein [Deltaproteobacteria bacterium]
MPSRVLPILFIPARLFLGGLFIYASIHKIMEPTEFAETIYYYQILPTQIINLLALIMPWLELATGILLLIGRFVLPSSIIVTAMLLIFGAAIGFNLARGLDFQCGCFAVSDQAHNENLITFFRDLLYLVPAVFCVIYGLFLGPRKEEAPVG